MRRHSRERPPNARVQRTRSSPSALRSPLMRCPLGGFRVSRIGVRMLAGFVVSLWVQTALPAQSQFGHPPHSGLAVRVYDSVGGGILPGMPVTVSLWNMVSTGDSTWFGITDSRGEALFPDLLDGTYIVTACAAGLYPEYEVLVSVVSKKPSVAVLALGTTERSHHPCRPWVFTPTAVPPTDPIPRGKTLGDMRTPTPRKKS